MGIQLSDLVVGEGFRFMVDPRPALLDTAVGNPGPTALCCVQRRGLDGLFAIACVGDSIDYAYSAAHEIAELTHEFDHTIDMFSTQACILARWCRRLG